MWQSVEILNDFSTLTLKQIFWKMKTFFKKLENRFLVESTKIENPSFLFKTAISEANVKTNRMVSVKWTYHKDWVLPVTTLFFWKLFFSLRNSYKELIWCTNDSNTHILTFYKPWSLTWDKEFKSGLSKLCGKQPLKNLKSYGLLKQPISLHIF